MLQAYYEKNWELISISITFTKLLCFHISSFKNFDINSLVELNDSTKEVEKTVPKVSWSVVCVCMHTVTFCEMITQKNFVSAPEFSRNTDFEVL